MVSVVIPVYNEKESLALLLGEIAEVARAAEITLERRVLAVLRRQHPRPDVDVV